MFNNRYARLMKNLWETNRVCLCTRNIYLLAALLPNEYNPPRGIKATSKENIEREPLYVNNFN